MKDGDLIVKQWQQILAERGKKRLIQEAVMLSEPAYTTVPELIDLLEWVKMERN